MLTINNLNVYYGSIQALKNINLNVRMGQIVTVVGANGAGKTTLLKTIMGLQKSQSGTIEVMGKDITNLPPFVKARMGISIVSGNRSNFGDFTVLENLLCGTLSGKWNPRCDLTEVYKLFPLLEKRQKQKARTLSGGESQMLAIAKCIIARPKLLLLDEPSMGLMPMIIRDIFCVIKTLAEEKGVTMLIVEQNVRKALQIADNVVVLLLGEICMEGCPSDLKDDPFIKKAYLGSTAY